MITGATSGRRRLQSFVFEVTGACNYDCPHCYNVWKGPAGYPPGELPTADTLAMLDTMLAQTGASLVTLSGGEPLLRRDVFEIVEYLARRGVDVNFLTNGSLLDERAVERLSAGKVSVFELPLLSVQRDIHDRMSGAAGAFDAVTMAIANLQAAGQRVVCVFVATLLNLHTWRQTAELAVALGADGIMFNRFNPGGACGRCRRRIEMLQAPPEMLADALDIAQDICEEYRLPISCSIAMPPCLFDHSRWPKLGFGFCAAGTERAYYTLDPLGNIRPCNHSPTILGNIREKPFWELADSQTMTDFVAARPSFCTGCKLESECLGGCKAAAEVCSGSPTQLDPFIARYRNQARKIADTP